MKKIILLCVAIAMLASCGKKPESSFTSDKTEISLGQAVQFNSTSTEAYYYHWKFGDGTSSREANPLHTFTKSGDFNVMLHVSNKGGDRWDNSYLHIKVNGYNSALLGNWAATGNYSSTGCGTDNQIYTMNIRGGNQSDELIVSNFVDFFSFDVKGTSVYGNSNKIEFSQNNIQNKSGESYNINGNFELSSGVLSINYTLTPSGTASCGVITGTGSAIAY